MDDRAAGEALDRIIAAFDGKERFLVQVHNNPDPDSLACGMALRYLVQRYTGKDAVLAFGGVVGRSENRAMVRQLGIPLVPGSLVDYSQYDFTAVCDTQPGTGYTSFPDGFVPTVVLDHHPCLDCTNQSAVAIVEPDYGATSSLMAQMLFAKGIPIPTDVATALYYGIKSETQDLARETRDVDARVYRKLAEQADRKLVSRIETERVPREYFQEMVTAIRGARVHRDLIVSRLGPVRFPDMVAEMADYLMRYEGASWSCVLGEHRDLLYISLRTNDESADAGDIIKRAVEGLGSAGGHLTMAGGQVPLDGLDADLRAERVEQVVAQWLRALGASDVEGLALVEEGEICG